MLAKFFSASWRWFLNALLSIGLVYTYSKYSIISWKFGNIPRFLDFSKVFPRWNPTKWEFKKIPQIFDKVTLPQLKTFLGFTLLLWVLLQTTDIPLRKLLGDKKEYRWQLVGFLLRAFQGWLCIVIISVFGKFTFNQATFAGLVAGFMIAKCRLESKD